MATCWLSQHTFRMVGKRFALRLRAPGALRLLLTRGSAGRGTKMEIDVTQDVANFRWQTAAIASQPGSLSIQNILVTFYVVTDQAVATALGGGGLTAIADQRTLANVSGVSAVPTATSPTAMRTMLSIQASSAVAITGGTIVGTTIALAPAQLSDGLVFVTGATGVLTNPTFTGLTLTAAVLKNDLITGLAGGQTIKGGTAATQNLTLTSTGNASKGTISLGDHVASYVTFDEASSSMNIVAGGGGTSLLTLTSTTNNNGTIVISNVTTGNSVSSNISQVAGATTFFAQLSGSGFSGTPGRYIQTLIGSSGDWYHKIQQAAGDYVWQTGASPATVMTPSNAGNLTMGAGLATTAVDGFLYVPSGAGPPTGTPTSPTLNNNVPIYIDRTNKKLYMY